MTLEDIALSGVLFRGGVLRGGSESVTACSEWKEELYQ